MAKLFMPEVSPEMRKNLLEQNADRVEETTYLRPITPEELDVCSMAYCIMNIL